MRIIYEEDIEKEDFLEVIISDKEAETLQKKGLAIKYPQALHSNRVLNVFIRVDSFNSEEEYAPSERQKQTSHIYQYQNGSSGRETSKASRSNSSQ